ncbi:MAG: BMP family ABC transporter substrate-binding protein, partial [Clostridia bacterium]|nr:BMP family ABC transporter substrate-binding protein [Clostridia bacterium]
MKKLICVIMALAMLFSFAACKGKDNGTSSETGNTANAYANVKIGLICLHDENSTYDNNFIQALKSVQTELGLSDDQVLIKTGIDESDACYNAAAEFVDAGCNVIFADSFGHET